MSEDPTRELPEESSFEVRVFAQFAALHGELATIRAEQVAIRTDIAALDSRLATVESRLTMVESRLTTLEEKVELRLSETRPIWEAVQYAIKRLEMKFDTVLADLYDVRTNSRLFDKRLMELEAR
ncbi:MAG TPA: hypothetical protein VGJ55_02595 [Pyrinomonadaceae bacterium]